MLLRLVKLLVALAHLVLKLSCKQKLTIRKYTVPSSSGFEKFTVGRARKDITPPPGYPMGGHSIAGKVARGYWTRLYARAFYFVDAGGGSLALVSCDLFAIPAGLRHEVCRLAARKGVPLSPDRLILSATHTHHGPGNFMTSELYNGFSSPWLGFDRRLFCFLARRIANAVVQAFKDAGESKSSDHCVTLRVGDAPNIQRNRAINAFFKNPEADRDLLISDSIKKGMLCPDKSFVNCPRYLAADPTLTVLEVLRNKERIALLVFFAVHPTAMSHENVLWSSDLTGRAMMLLEGEGAAKSESPGGAPGSLVAGFFNGAEGDVSPRWKCQDRDDVMELGDKLASAVRKVLQDEGRRDTTGKITISSEDFRIGGRGQHSACFDSSPEFGVPAVGGAEDGRTWLYYYGWHGGVFSDKVRKGQGRKRPAADIKGIGILKLLNLTHFLAPPRSFPRRFPVSIARIGDVLTIGAIPVEMTSMLGRRIRENIGGAELRGTGKPHFVLVGLANEYFSYTTTPEEYDAQDYEGASTIFGREEGNRICELLHSVAELPVEATNGNSLTNRAVPAMKFNVGPKPLVPFGPRFQADGNPCQPDTESVALLDEDLLPDFPGSLFRLNSRAPRFEWVEDAGTDWCTEKRKVSIYERENDRWAPLKIDWHDPGSGVLDPEFALPENDEGADILTVLLQSDRGKRRWAAIWLPPEDIDKTEQYLFRVETGAGEVRCSEPFDLRNMPNVEPSDPIPCKACPPLK